MSCFVFRARSCHTFRGLSPGPWSQALRSQPERGPGRGLTTPPGARCSSRRCSLMVYVVAQSIFPPEPPPGPEPSLASCEPAVPVPWTIPSEPSWAGRLARGQGRVGPGGARSGLPCVLALQSWPPALQSLFAGCTALLFLSPRKEVQCLWALRLGGPSSALFSLGAETNRRAVTHGGGSAAQGLAGSARGFAGESWLCS